MIALTRVLFEAGKQETPAGYVTHPYDSTQEKDVNSSEGKRLLAIRAWDKSPAGTPHPDEIAKQAVAQAKTPKIEAPVARKVIARPPEQPAPVGAVRKVARTGDLQHPVIAPGTLAREAGVMPSRTLANQARNIQQQTPGIPSTTSRSSFGPSEAGAAEIPKRVAAPAAVAPQAAPQAPPVVTKLPAAAPPQAPPAAVVVPAESPKMVAQPQVAPQAPPVATPATPTQEATARVTDALAAKKATQAAGQAQQELTGAQHAGIALQKGAHAVGDAAGSLGHKAVEFAHDSPMAAGAIAGAAGVGAALGLRRIMQGRKQA